MQKIAESQQTLCKAFLCIYSSPLPGSGERNHAKHDFSWIAKGVAVKVRNSYTLRDSGIEQLLFWQKKTAAFWKRKLQFSNCL